MRDLSRFTTTIMTRQKKTRSLSRIHKVKTGNIAKLKRAAAADRQGTKKVDKSVKSVYQKFLEENPDAKKRADAEQRKAEIRKEQRAEKPVAEKTEPKAKREREEDIFDRFERGGLDDIY